MTRTLSPDPRAVLPLLTESENNQPLIAWNTTQAPYPRDRCVHRLFEAQVEQTPDAIAVIYEDQQLTYRELNARANQLAHALRQLGVGPDVLVALCLDRSLEMVVGLLGILKAEGAYVPLDLSYPEERLAFMLADTQAKVLLTQKHLLATLPLHRAQVLCLDRDWSTIGHESEENLTTSMTAEHLAYVIYTSGSTGRPKGVEVPHRGIVRLVCGSDYVHFDAKEVFLQLAPISFDAATFEIWGALLHGATCVLFPERLLTPQSLAAVLKKHHVSTLWLTASLFNSLIDQTPEILTDIKQLLTGGEALSVCHVRRALTLLSNTQLFNGYGPTESTTFACTYAIPRRIEDTATSIPIGRPIANTTVYILDSYLAPVPIGVVGELYIGGDGLARGYLHRPELTTEKFIPDPFSDQPGARLYRTGDLARYLPDGNIEFLGRIDLQVKIRGYRIELGEIETVLSTHPAVQTTVVLAREDKPGDKRLIAYIVAPHDISPAPSELRSFLQKTLPEYMLPSAFVFMESLPLTPNGKVDRGALPQPDRASHEREEEIVRPRTPVEEIVAQIWAEVLRLDTIGIHENFFELGGHSLLAMQIMSRLYHILHVDLTLRVLFEDPTIAGLAATIETTRLQETVEKIPLLLPASRNSNLPLSFAQQRLWFLDQLEPGSSAYNISDAVRLRGSLDVAALEQSINEIVRRHEVLRTTFPVVDGHSTQFIVPSLQIALSVVDLTQISLRERDAAARQQANAEAHRPFTLAQGPLLRVMLLRVKDDDHILIVTFHHSVTDGWSQEVFYRELATLYQAFRNGQPSPLPELSIQYADYAVWQREWLQGEVLERQLDYWKTQLQGAPPVLNLPLDRPRPVKQTCPGAGESLSLSPSLTQALKALSHREGVTLFMTLLAAWQTLLARYTGQDDIVVGAPIAGRAHHELEGLIGFFVNTLVLRTDLSGAPSFRELLGRVRNVTLGAYAHQDLPFEKLVEILQPERNLSYSPLFQVLFNMLPLGHRHIPAFAEILVEPFFPDEEDAKFDLTLYVDPNETSIELQLVYNTALFDANRMQELLCQFECLIEQIVQSPDTAIGEYSLLTARARQLLPDPTEILAEPSFPPVTSELLAWAERLPEQKAVTQQGNFWTYKELSASAQRLARSIIAHGVKPGDVVAVTGPRCFGMISSLVGAFMSGGVLLTIDRNLPVKRQRLMLETARAKCLLYIGNWRSEDLWLRTIPGLCLVAVTQNGGKEMGTRESSVLDDVTLPAISPDDPAYIFFTSGTTGVPKAVLGCHKGLSHFLAWQRQRFAIGPSDRCAQLTGLSFDVVLRDVFLPLTSGATLVLPDDSLEPASEQTLSWLDSENITLFHGVPTLAQNWVGDTSSNARLRHLRWAFFAGEPLTSTLVQQWRKAFPEAGEIINLYGPTETTLVKCFQVIPREPFPGVQPIGGPLPQTQALVVNSCGQICGVGEPGEIVLRTPFRTRGYLNAPDETTQRFVPNPFRSDPRDLVYRTGDGGRYRPDGTLEILGRLDNQVKIRGVRIEPDEVTAILGQHPQVKSCFVAAHNRPDETPILAAYVVPCGPTPVTPQALRSHLGLHLPAAAIPSAVIFLDVLPLSPNGKVDRRALPKLKLVTSESQGAFVAPRTETEQVLADIWGKLLKLATVSIQDNFFELGGHSLLAVQLVSRIQRAFHVILPLRKIFESPTIQSLALEVLKQQAKVPSHDDVTRLLAKLASMSEEDAQRELHTLESQAQSISGAAVQTDSFALSSFHCPQVPSELFGKRECNLIIVINEHIDKESFQRVASIVEELDPRIKAVVLRDGESATQELPNRPTLIFSPAIIRHRPPRPGQVFCGYPLSKSEEYAALTQRKIPVPQWVLLTEGASPDLSGFADYVVRKPNYGGASAGVGIVHRDQVRWKPITARVTETNESMIIQQFVYTGVLPISYRVSTLFGRVLNCLKYRANAAHVELPTPAHLASAIRQKTFTIAAPGRGCHIEPCFDEEIIRLGERAHTAFPEIPLLGFDIVQEVPSGKLYVLEANAIGYTWLLSKDREASFDFPLEEQFDGVRKAAYILAEKTQQFAE